MAAPSIFRGAQPLAHKGIMPLVVGHRPAITPGPKIAPARTGNPWVISWDGLSAVCPVAPAAGNALARINSDATTSGIGRYFEATVWVVGSGSMDVGLSYSDQSKDDFVHNDGVAYISDGRLNYDGGTVSTGTGYSGPIVIGIFLDETNHFYARQVGNAWEGGANADARTGGIDVSGFFPAFTFAPAVSTNGDGTSVTFNIGATPFAGQIPVNGVSWDGSQAASSTTYNDNLSESAASADSLSPAGSTFAVPLAESAAAAESEAAAQTFVNTLAESAAAGDSVTGGLLLTGSLNEAVTPADMLATAVTFASADAESAVAADNVNPAGSIFGVPLAESAAAADALGVGLVMPVSASESAVAGDAEASSQTFVNTLGESAAAADSLSAGLVIVKSLNESAAAADAATVAVTFGPALSESAAAGEAEASQAVMPNALGEQAVAGDSEASAQVFTETLAESAGATDNVSAGATTYNEVVNENLTALASLGVGLVLPVAVVETTAAADAEGAAADLAASLGEAAVANDDFVGALTSLYPPGPVDPARIGIVDRQSGTAAIAASSRSEAVAAIRRNGRVAASARIGIVNRASGRVG